uniref:Uncharacterized protein n=1 Tax=Ananas comosus var. bracteatus TaxID=296719 RepID=A0A6V7PQE7_ANACO|nr:unnamed protein product [Ananas comosus var. bracteatus]
MEEVQGASVDALLPNQRQEEDGAGLAQLALRRPTVAKYEMKFSRLLHCVPFRRAGRRGQRPAFFERGCDRRFSGLCNPLTSKTYRVGGGSRAHCGERPRQMFRRGERPWIKARVRGPRLRVRARRTLGGRRSTLGASSEDAARQRSEEVLTIARPPRV